MSRLERKARAQKKVETYCREFAKAARKVAVERPDTPMQDLLEQPEMEDAYCVLRKENPQERNLIDQGLKLFVDKLIAKHKQMMERTHG